LSTRQSRADRSNWSKRQKHQTGAGVSWLTQTNGFQVASWPVVKSATFTPVQTTWTPPTFRLSLLWVWAQRIQLFLWAITGHVWSRKSNFDFKYS
jgi:hypothetical protein